MYLHRESITSATLSECPAKNSGKLTSNLRGSYDWLFIVRPVNTVLNVVIYNKYRMFPINLIKTVNLI